MHGYLKDYVPVSSTADESFGIAFDTGFHVVGGGKRCDDEIDYEGQICSANDVPDNRRLELHLVQESIEYEYVKSNDDA
jgi:hypothetical protein